MPATENHVFLISRRGTCDQASYIAVVVVVYRQGDDRCRSVAVVSVQIHIDAHSDDDNPEYVAGMPFFRYPKTDSEISYFMQKNDVFVQVCSVQTYTIFTHTYSWQKRLGLYTCICDL